MKEAAKPILTVNFLNFCLNFNFVLFACYINFLFGFFFFFSGDVLLHCVVDAILGALGLPDIGQIFPDSDPKWKGAPSSVFIKEAVRIPCFFFPPKKI